MPLQLDITHVKDRLSFWEDYFCYVYLVVVTLTTVGYGDITAKSMLGKTVIMISAIWGAFIISLIVLVVASVFDLKKQQKKAMRDIHVTRKASLSISRSIKYFLQKKKYYLTMLKIKPQIYRHSEFL